MNYHIYFFENEYKHKQQLLDYWAVESGCIQPILEKDQWADGEQSTSYVYHVILGFLLSCPLTHGFRFTIQYYFHVNKIIHIVYYYWSENS